MESLSAKYVGRIKKYKLDILNGCSPQLYYESPVLVKEKHAFETFGPFILSDF